MPQPFTITLPIADRRRSHTFYQDGLGLDPVGDVAQDGLPEPLQFRLLGEAYLCLVPTEAFDWVLGPRELSPAEHSECLLGIALADAQQVTAMTERLVTGGGTVLTPPTHQPWGFESLVADPDGHAWQLYVG
ncbi:VOC family protein [Nesterenkonia sp. AY15]|uniref:VOC family protein n=1 Tax=Nesterenkonia sp. AY15 TaxID=2901139 RepID=UPI001F4C9BA8|nr:VOC family protein [Nesterenkonia sp. AY15]MCH8571413.1 VOC family protein [Nesterenkonia sp. AY15]